MAQKIRQKTLMPNAVIDGQPMSKGLELTANTAAGVTAVTKSRPDQFVTMTLESVRVSIASTDDFGSVKLCDLPTTGLKLTGVIVSLTGVVAGTTGGDGATVDLAVGSAATASTDFSGTNEKNALQKVDCTGGAGVLAASGISNQATASATVAQGTNALYLNVSSPVAASTATIDFSGTIHLTFKDLGAT